MADDHIGEIAPDRSAEGWLRGTNGVELYWQGWLPPSDPVGVVLLCHGAGEHAGRYGNVVRRLLLEGWAVYGLDQRGHGRSTGDRVHLEDYADLLNDFDIFRQHIAGRHREIPVFLLGHSVGGQIALAYALHHQHMLEGVVLSAPFLAVQSVPKVLRPAARLGARILPSIRPRMVNLDNISKDPAVVRRYREDPLVFQGAATLNFATLIAEKFATLPHDARNLRLPVLLQYGTMDKISDPEGCKALQLTCGSRDLLVIEYTGLWHEIYNEPERDGPLGDLSDWLAEHL